MLRRTMSFLSCSFVCFCMLGPNTGSANIVTTTGDKFPVRNGLYETGPTGSTTYGTIETEMVSMSLRSTGPGTILPGAGQTLRIDSFFDVFVDFRIGATGESFQIDSFFDVFFEVTADGGGTGTFQTEMLSMDLTGTGPAGPNTLIMRLDPGPPSSGQHVVTDLGNGTFQIDSFFDVFTELSIDNGASFHTASNSFRVTLNSVVPEPTSLVVLAPLFGCVMLRRRKK